MPLTRTKKNTILKKRSFYKPPPFYKPGACGAFFLLFSTFLTAPSYRTASTHTSPSHRPIRFPHPWLDPWKQPHRLPAPRVHFRRQSVAIWMLLITLMMAMMLPRGFEWRWKVWSWKKMKRDERRKRCNVLLKQKNRDGTLHRRGRIL